MQNIVVNVCEKFQGDRLRNDKALGIENLIITTPRTSTRTTTTTLVAFGDPFPGPKKRGDRKREEKGDGQGSERRA